MKLELSNRVSKKIFAGYCFNYSMTLYSLCLMYFKNLVASFSFTGSCTFTRLSSITVTFLNTYPFDLVFTLVSVVSGP